VTRAAPVFSSPVLVTGAAGFVGANLVARLTALGATVHGIIRPGSNPWRIEDVLGDIECHTLDLRHADAVADVVARVSPGVVFHCAKQSGHPAHMSYRDAYETNLFGALSLLEAVSPGTRFVMLGSSLEYGPGDRALSEDASLRPNTVHGVTKAATTALCAHFAQARGLAVVTLRLFTVYGPWESPERFIPTLVRCVRTGQPFALTGPGLVHDWIHVDDVVDACVMAAQAAITGGDVVNIGTGLQTANEDVVAIIERLIGRELPRQSRAYDASVHDRPCWMADIAKARDTLQWAPQLQLVDGLAATLDWFGEHGEAYGW
jgi:nucleoside-diphosphate-sugar epimerase